LFLLYLTFYFDFFDFLNFLLEFVQVLFSFILFDFYLNLKMSYLAETPNKINEKRGRRFTDIWNNMIKGEKQSKGHYSATCIHCRQY